MKHRERVLMALDHRAPDRCPMQISFTPEFAARLRQDLQLQGRSVHNPHGAGNSYELEKALDEDMLLTSVGWANSYYGPGYTARKPYVDEWGVGWQAVEYATPYGVGAYTEMMVHPLADPRALASYRAPDPQRPELYAEAERVIREFGDEYWIVGVTVTTIFETAWALRGYARLLEDLVADPDLAEQILDIPYRYHLAAATRLAQMGVDMIWVGDDVGGQHGMVMSPACWRRFLKPRLASMIAALKATNPCLKIAYHSDGKIDPIIPELIEIGVDVLNPIQPACMDPLAIKAQYGNRLCFWGSLDEQHTLPFGTPRDVAQEVRARLRTLGQGGGLILGPTHHVQLDTPMENFWAMVNTITHTPYAPAV
jgi:uroporphyrinogen decarboxylase